MIKLEEQGLDEMEAQDMSLEIKFLEMNIQSLLVRYKFFRTKVFIFKGKDYLKVLDKKKKDLFKAFKKHGIT